MLARQPRLQLPLVGLVGLALLMSATPAGALPVPSKTTPDQSVAERDADLAAIHEVLADDEVEARLAAHGLTPQQVHERLAQLSPEELHNLSSQLDQVHAAGGEVPEYIWFLTGALLVVLILTTLL